MDGTQSIMNYKLTDEWHDMRISIDQWSLLFVIEWSQESEPDLANIFDY